MASVSKVLEEATKKVLKEANAHSTEVVTDLDDRLTDKTENIIDTVSTKFQQIDKLVKNFQEATLKNINDVEDKMRVKYDDQGVVNLSIFSDLQAIKVSFEAMRKPFTTEMNNIRKENENINRELIRMSKEMRDLAAQQAFYPRTGLNLPSHLPPPTVNNTGSPQSQFNRKLYNVGNKTQMTNGKHQTVVSEPLRATFEEFHSGPLQNPQP